MPGVYIAKLTDNDTSREVRYGKPITPVSTGVLKIRVKVKYTNLIGGIRVAVDENTMGLPASNQGLLAMGGGGDGTINISDYTGRLTTVYGNAVNDVWYILELIIDFTNAQVTGRVYDINGNLLGESTITLPSHITQVGCISLIGVGGPQTGIIYFDDFEVYVDDQLVLSDDFEDGDVSDWNHYFGNGTFEAVQVSWKVNYNGRALKVNKGESGSVSFTIIPNDSTDTITISVVENPSNLDVNIDPSQVTLDGITEVTVNVTINVPQDIPYKPLYILKLQLQGSVKTDYVYIGVLPIVPSENNRFVLREAESDQEGYWVGAPGSVLDGEYIYVTYRRRNPTDRGYKLVLGKIRLGETTLQDIKEWRKGDYGYVSFEKSDIVKKPDGGYMILYGAEYNGLWRVFRIDVENMEDMDLPGQIVLNDHKDPSIVYLPDKGYYIVGVAGTISDGSHLRKLFKYDGSTFTHLLTLPANEWAPEKGAIGELHYIDGYVVVWYDAKIQEGGLAQYAPEGVGLYIPDTNEFIDLTPDKPLLESIYVKNGTFRYVAIITTDDRMYLIAEEQQPDGSHDLVLYYAEAPLPPSSSPPPLLPAEQTADYIKLARLCFMMETMKSLTRREHEPDYSKCVNILLMATLIEKLYESQAK